MKQTTYRLAFATLAITFASSLSAFATGFIGDLVWKDTNGNGIQDSGEPGIRGVLVNLKRNDVVINTKTTDSAGRYAFTGLPAGTYKVSVDPSQSALAGCVRTVVNAPGSTAANDNNPNPATVVLPTNTSTNKTVDFGFRPLPTGSIGDCVWKDTNCNGIQDYGEPIINGVVVQLKRNGVVVATKTTAGNGAYRFTGLAAGTYQVCVDITQPALADCIPTRANAPGSTAATDSNPNPASVVLATNSSIDPTVDFGFCPAPKCLVLVLDEDSIDNTSPGYFLPPNTGQGINGQTWSAGDVNDDRTRLAQRTPLRFFNNPANFGRRIVIRSGQVGDEGLFAVKTIPDSWSDAGPTSSGLKNYLGDPGLSYPHNVGNGLGTGNDPESRLDKIPDVTPLRAAGLRGLIGRTVCAIVYDSDISINYGPLNGSLKGENNGVVAFKVLEVKQAIGFSSSTLPLLTIEIVDPLQAFAGQQELYLSAPEPPSSSTPFDITP